MTRRDSDVGGNDAEGDRGGSVACSSRPPPPPPASSPNEGPLREQAARKGSDLLADLSKLTPERQRLVITGGANVDGDDERKKNECRGTTDVVEATGSGESVRQRFRRKMDGCLVQVIEASVACGHTDANMTTTTTTTTTAAVINTSIFSSASGPSTPAGETRLPASILFELPESCGTSGTETTEKMPAITKAQMKEFEEAFNLFDKDRDGSITKEELGRVMRGLGQFARTEELRTMLEEIDTDGDGNVSLVEFVKIVSNIGSASAAAPTDLSQEEQEEQELRDAFRVFDKHNRGYITASDLRAVLQCLGEDLSEEEIEDMIKEVDEDGDGRIDFYEFARSLVEPGTDDEDEEDDEEEIPQSP